jgi:hypothetical protein
MRLSITENFQLRLIDSQPMLLAFQTPWLYGIVLSRYRPSGLNCVPTF